ncbi:hypothetical protein V6N11_072148 [Hibiscus sabdariffa]|uniref:Fe2OG dioxygenase domain-containing protein n=1 Tax=Hibiscus sabdariffa TaxID=183260 RepID=A0ABR2U2H8_9ROSI
MPPRVDGVLFRATIGCRGLTVEKVGQFYSSTVVPASDKNESDQTQCVLQLNSYSVCPDTDRAMGLAPHTDTSLVTLLNQCNINGIQVYQDGARWVVVEPVEGALVVIVGDLMQIVSNGRFKSVLHRSVVNNTCHRVSTTFFLGPWSDAEVSLLRKLVDSAHPPLYQPVTGEGYVQLKYTVFNKALESICV